MLFDRCCADGSVVLACKTRMMAVRDEYLVYPSIYIWYNKIISFKTSLPKTVNSNKFSKGVWF